MNDNEKLLRASLALMEWARWVHLTRRILLGVDLGFSEFHRQAQKLYYEGEALRDKFYYAHRALHLQLGLSFKEAPYIKMIVKRLHDESKAVADFLNGATGSADLKDVLLRTPPTIEEMQEGIGKDVTDTRNVLIALGQMNNGA